MDDLKALLRKAEAPTPLPEQLGAKLQHIWMGAAIAAVPYTPEHDPPRKLPRGMKRRLARSFGVKRAYGPSPMILGALASVVLLLAGAGMVMRSPNAPSPATGSGGKDPQNGASAPAFPSTAEGDGAAEPSTGGDARAIGSSPVTIIAKPPGSRGKPPPFHSEGALYSAPPSSEDWVASETTVARIGVIKGDRHAEAGFFTYVDHLNRQGGIGHRRIEVVELPACAARQDVLFTVNLGVTPIARDQTPSWLATPLLENLSAPRSALLHEDVFSISSSAERQGRLLADHLLEDEGLRARPLPIAVIYRHPDGIFGTEVPKAIREILEGAGVKVLTLDYGVASGSDTCGSAVRSPGSNSQGEDPPRLVPADVAILSMDPVRAKRFLEYASAQAYSPPLGFDGVYSLFEESIAPWLTQPSSIMSPYWVGNPAEEQAIRDGATSRSASFGASAIHGWATAKAIAVALWRFDPKTPREAQSALDSLGPTDLGVAPFGYRSRSHERSVDGLLLRSDGSRFVRSSGFLSDRR